MRRTLTEPVAHPPVVSLKLTKLVLDGSTSPPTLRGEFTREAGPDQPLSTQEFAVDLTVPSPVRAAARQLGAAIFAYLEANNLATPGTDDVNT